MTIFSGSKEDVLNQDYRNVETLQITGLLTAEITARLADDPDGTIYHNRTLNKLQVKLNGILETIAVT